MAQDQAKPPPKDEGPPGPGAWMISFNDCMTNMLCFFVLLASFSSFDPASRARISGGFRAMSLSSVFSSRYSPTDSSFPPIDRPVDRTETGSEKPTDGMDNVMNPRESFWLDCDDAYKAKQEFYIPSSRLFWGQGSALSPSGREFLDMLAPHMRNMPHQIVIGQAGAGELPPDSTVARSAVVLGYLTRNGGVSADRMSISADVQAAPKRFGDKPVMRIVMLQRSVYK